MPTKHNNVDTEWLRLLKLQAAKETRRKAAEMIAEAERLESQAAELTRANASCQQ